MSEAEWYARKAPIWICPRKKPEPVACPDCGKPCGGQAGVMAHQNAKHGYTHKGIDIRRLGDTESSAYETKESPHHG